MKMVHLVPAPSALDADPAGKGRGGGNIKPPRCPMFLQDTPFAKSNKTLSHYQFNLLTVLNREKKSTELSEAKAAALRSLKIEKREVNLSESRGW